MNLDSKLDSKGYYVIIIDDVGDMIGYIDFDGYNADTIHIAGVDEI